MATNTSIVISKPVNNVLLHNNNYHNCLSSSATLFPSTSRRFRDTRKKRAVPISATLVLNGAVFSVSGDKKPAVTTTLELRALVTVRKSQPNKKLIDARGMMLNWLNKQAVSDPGQEGVLLQLVSTETDPNRTKPKRSQEAILDLTKNRRNGDDQNGTYEVRFKVDSTFGMPGAILVSNRYGNEFYLENVNIIGVVYFACNTWVQPHKANSPQRIFFSTRAYLPSETPEGLKELREMELRQLRGDGTGLRLVSDRVYDYDT